MESIFLHLWRGHVTCTEANSVNSARMLAESLKLWRWAAGKRRKLATSVVVIAARIRVTGNSLTQFSLRLDGACAWRNLRDCKGDLPCYSSFHPTFPFQPTYEYLSYL